MIKDNKSLFKKFNDTFESKTTLEREAILFNYFSDRNDCYQETLKSINFPKDITVLIDYFESLHDDETSNKMGIIFTPKYIADFIVEDCIKEFDKTILDPACGCGIFLVSAIELLIKHKISPKDAFNQIYGIDKNEDNVRRCKIVLQIMAYKYNLGSIEFKNIICTDSLKNSYLDLFNLKDFFYIVGNPPYVNPHDLDPSVSNFLKEEFNTTKQGTANIFYAFIEHSSKYLNLNGKLSFIVPNNFLTISAGKSLRQFIYNHNFLEKIIDLGSNMVFAPTRTYNCIITLSPKEKKDFYAGNIVTSTNVEDELKRATCIKLAQNKLNNDKWLLKDESVFNNIKKIENQDIKLKNLIRTGIATLKDGVFIVDYDKISKEFYKVVNNQKFIIENNVVKDLYKIPDLNKSNDLREVVKHIIFPYSFNEALGKYEIIEETKLKNEFPLTYAYLLHCANELKKRDKGKTNSVAWYAYGRSQGLNNHSDKILFPTFSNFPKFRVVRDKDALFCNGYCIVEPNPKVINLEILCKIINSEVMRYYISHTSYPIEGGYYCYQKKYIQDFSIPNFSENEKKYISTCSAEELNNFLLKRYQLKI